MPRSLLLTLLLLPAACGAAAGADGGDSGGVPGKGPAWADSVRRLVLPDSLRVVPAPRPGDSLRARPADSLPTRPRAGEMAPAAASAAGDSLRGRDQRPWHRQPRWIMLRSIAVPGWGQWANGRRGKAAVVAAGEGYLLARALDYARKERDIGREASLAASDPALQAKLLERKRYYGSRRRDFTWWSIFAAVLSMGDAYVDAQLGAFDPEFVPQDGSGGFVLDRLPGLRVGLRLRLP